MSRIGTHEDAKKFLEFFCKNPLTNPLKYDTIRVSRGDVLIPLSVGQHLHRTGTAQKNVKNLLTNPHLCDTIRVQKERATPLRAEPWRCKGVR